jgi:hypothetical protein
MLTPTLLVPLVLAAPQQPKFEPPVRMRAGDSFVKVEAPGYACPSWHDVDKDGKKDLVVGQFSKGKMKVHKGLGGTKLATGEWLRADGAVAEVPGVW